MTRIIDQMCAAVPENINNEALRPCLSAMCEASITLTVRCAAVAREYQARRSFRIDDAINSSL